MCVFRLKPPDLDLDVWVCTSTCIRTRRRQPHGPDMFGPGTLDPDSTVLCPDDEIGTDTVGPATRVDPVNEVGPDTVDPVSKVGPDMIDPDRVGPDMFGADIFRPGMFGSDSLAPDIFGPTFLGPDGLPPGVLGADMFGPDSLSDSRELRWVPLRSEFLKSTRESARERLVTMLCQDVDRMRRILRATSALRFAMNTRTDRMKTALMTRMIEPTAFCSVVA
jgi:hypothetical protein